LVDATLLALRQLLGADLDRARRRHTAFHDTITAPTTQQHAGDLPQDPVDELVPIR
jgi:hypothetical protein